MRLLAALERRFGRYAVPNVTMALILGQIVTYAVCYGIDNQPGRETDPPAEWTIALIPSKVLAGEVWRLATFLIMPPASSPIFVAFFWMFFWFVGNSMEAYWGTFRYNVYLLVGYAATVAAAFVAPDVPTGNAFIQVSVFLAFAWLNPEFPMYLFFVLMVPIKWLARLTWAVLLLSFAVGAWEQKAQTAAVVLNFLLFFGREVVEQMRTGHRHMTRKAAAFAEEPKKPDYHHKCRVCGLTDADDRKMEFRYCSKCAGDCCYCRDHLKTHEHVVG
jgi:hypothetical protein